MRQILLGRAFRDAALFFSGLGLIFNEAVLRTGPERPSMIVLFGAMVGLPVFLRQAEKDKE